MTYSLGKAPLTPHSTPIPLLPQTAPTPFTPTGTRAGPLPAGLRRPRDAPFDLDAVSHIYAQDETFSSFDFGRPHDGFQSWAPADAYYRKFMTVPKVWRLEANDDLRVHIRGDVAWSTVSLVGSGEMPDGTPISMPEARVTLILEKRGGEWLIVHEHGSSALPIPDMETTRQFLQS